MHSLTKYNQRYKETFNQDTPIDWLEFTNEDRRESLRKRQELINKTKDEVLQKEKK